MSAELVVVAIMRLILGYARRRSRAIPTLILRGCILFVMGRTSFGFVTVCIVGFVGTLSAQDVGPTAMAPIPDFGRLFPTRQSQASHLALVNAAPALTAKTLQPVAKPISVVQHSGRCSVPLREMRIPPDKDFSIEKQVPSNETLAPMPKAVLPAPSCVDAQSTH